MEPTKCKECLYLDKELDNAGVTGVVCMNPDNLRGLTGGPLYTPHELNLYGGCKWYTKK